jgi:uncharacterized membrane protein
MSGLEAFFRWMHIFAGVMWIGLLYFFNFVNGPFGATLDGDSKKKVMPELLPRALFWFRWGAAWTWITGVVLLMVVFYHGKTVMADQANGWMTGTIVMVVVTFLAVFLYDALFKSALGKNVKVAVTVAFILTAIILYLMATWGAFSYRGYNIHIGAMFGTMMAFNVWYRIWPAQQKIIAAIKNGQAPDKDLAALAGSRSKHNTYMSLPLFWAMINTHTAYFAGNNLGIPADLAWGVLLVVILLGWHIIWHCYKKAAKVKGF